MPKWIDEACQQLTLLPKHPEGVPDDVWVTGWALLDALKDIADLEALPTPFASPIEGGGLQIEWDLNGRHVEIEFADHEDLVVLWAEGDNARTTGFPASHVERVVGLLKWLLRGGTHG